MKENRSKVIKISGSDKIDHFSLLSESSVTLKSCAESGFRDAFKNEPAANGMGIQMFFFRKNAIVEDR